MKKSLLITGGSGSFGQAFTRHALAGDVYDRICIYSRSEHAQAKMREAFKNQRLRFFIGDVRDRDRLRRAMTGCHDVIHAAALKRIEVGYYNPIEMARTNVDGAINTIEAARDADVERLVALSTDKAFQPVSPYGHSKALAEWIFLAAQSQGRSPIISITRYGNVAGSAGSVIPIWRAMLERGETVLPVTDPECTRFWMTMQEAIDMVQLVLDRGEGCDIFTAKLPAYRLGDLAIAMGATDIRVTGLSRGEKIHESMKEGQSSADARRMSIDELRAALENV